MAQVVSLASGKGGVGKSTVAVNLAVLSAQVGLRTVLVDLDLGGGDAHLLLGELAPRTGLEAFLSRSEGQLAACATEVASVPGLLLVSGGGDTLRSVNPTHASKRKLARHIRKLPADVVFLDVGAGCGLHALDFFLLGDTRLLVATPEPTSVMDVYKFVKLAAIRHVVSHFLAREAISVELSGRDVRSLGEVMEVVQTEHPDAAASVRVLVEAFAVALVVNQVSGTARLDTLRLAAVVREFVGSQLSVCGAIPEDEHVSRAVARLRPVVLAAPAAPASQALAAIFRALRGDLRALGTTWSDPS